jgi:deoxyribodipyrimidine photolyase-related protein
MNSLEGTFVKVIGWREFMRGIYQVILMKWKQATFLSIIGKMKKSWYRRNTGLPPLDHAIQNAKIMDGLITLKGLMILSNIMNPL